MTKISISRRRYISDVLSTEAVPNLQRALKVTFRQDDTKTVVANAVVACLDTEGVRLSQCPASYPDIFTIESISCGALPKDWHITTRQPLPYKNSGIRGRAEK